MGLDAQITMSMLVHESSNGDISRTLRATPVSYHATLSDGTGANQAQVAWSDSRTLSGSTDVLALSALNDLRQGATATVTMTAVKAAYVVNSGTVTLTFAGGPFAAGGESVAPGAAAAHLDASAAGMAASGITVTGSTGGSYDILLVGEGTVS